MKTLKTKLGIEFDIEVVEYTNTINTTYVKFTATCEEGSKEFKIDFENYGQKEEIDESYIEESDLSDVCVWVNTITCQFIASEFTKLEIEKSNDSVYYSCVLSRHGRIRLDAYIHDMNDNMSIIELHEAVGENDIKELLNILNK